MDNLCISCDEEGATDGGFCSLCLWDILEEFGFDRESDDSHDYQENFDITDFQRDPFLNLNTLYGGS